MRTLDEFACSSVGGGAQDPKVTLAGAGMILGALEVGKAVVAAGVTVVSVTGAGVAVTVGPVAAGGGYLVGSYAEEQLTKHFGWRDWVADCVPHTPGLDLLLLLPGRW